VTDNMLLGDDYGPEHTWPDADRLSILDDTALALSHVFSGADTLDAGGFMDALEEYDLAIVRKP
jgi:hypothetical protein